MNVILADLASLAEIVGTIAVVLSLLFVGIQIRRGNRETRAATLQSALRMEMDFGTTALSHVDMWQKVLSGEPTTGETDTETRRAILLFNMLMIQGENWFGQFEAGILNEQTWSTRRDVILELASLPIFGTWRKTGGARAHSRGFLALLDSAPHG